MDITLLPAGEAALVAQLGETIDEELNAAVHALDAALRQNPPPGLVEATPTYRSLLVEFDPLLTDAAAMGRAVAALGAGIRLAGPGAGRRWRLPVCFGGPHGIDLDAVAAAAGLSPREVIDLHCAADYHVYMIGFSPGFAYLGRLPEALHLARRETPRLTTPAGSFMQGGAQAALSPLAMPSGWHLLGRTPVRIFDKRRPKPFLLAPGDRLRIVPVDGQAFDRIAADPEYLADSEAAT